MKILNFGSCNIDYVYSMDHIVTVGETETTYSMEIFPGGKGLNQSIALAKAGVKVYHAGCVGCDGEILLNTLSENGIDISYVEQNHLKSGHAIIQVSKSGENSIFLYPGSNETVSKEHIERVLENFGKGDFIILQNEISNVGYIIDKAYEKEMCIVFNPSPINEKIKEIDFNKITYILLNEVEVAAISGCCNLEDSCLYIKNTYPNLRVVLTLGSKGCIYIDKNNKIYQSAFKVNVVDTTAAGDTFTGYFVAEISRGTEYKKCLEIASAASAIAVSRKGAAPSIPGIQEVFPALESMKENNEKLRDGLFS